MSGRYDTPSMSRSIAAWMTPAADNISDASRSTVVLPVPIVPVMIRSLICSLILIRNHYARPTQRRAAWADWSGAGKHNSAKHHIDYTATSQMPIMCYIRNMQRLQRCTVTCLIVFLLFSQHALEAQ